MSSENEQGKFIREKRTEKGLSQRGQGSFQQQDPFEAHTYISVEDLTDDEIADIKKYIEFIKSKRGS